MLRKTAFLYLILLHLLVITILIKTDFVELVVNKFTPQDQVEITPLYSNMVALHSRIDKNLNPDSVLFIGDSHIQGLAVSSVIPNAVNYGIGNDTTAGVLKRLPIYRSMVVSKSIVIAIGFNDLRYRNNSEIISNLDAILSLLPKNVAVVLCGIHPVGLDLHHQYTRRIEELNLAYEQLSLNYQNVKYLNTFEAYRSEQGSLLPEFHLQDNVHLSREGYQLWIDKLASVLGNSE